MSAVQAQISLSTEDATTRLGRALASRLRPGSVLLLEGEIGAGKSFLARAIIKTLCGKDTEVPSPTYTLVQTYQSPDVEIWHADLYRLGDAEETVELGLVDAFSEGICIVEWPDRLGPYRPKEAITIRMTAGPDHHSALIHGKPDWIGTLAKAVEHA